MLNKIAVSSLVLFVLSLSFGDDHHLSNDNISKQEIIEIGGYNVRKADDGNYLIDIYASNSKFMAGFQFELLGQDFEILDAFGGRAAHSGFSFYNGKGGIILAFSLKGNSVAPVEEVYKKVNPLFTIKVKKNNNKASFLNLKTLVSSQKGVKLDSKFVSVEVK